MSIKSRIQKILKKKTPNLSPNIVKKSNITVRIKEYNPSTHRSSYFKNEIEKERKLFFTGGENRL